MTDSKWLPWILFLVVFWAAYNCGWWAGRHNTIEMVGKMWQQKIIEVTPKGHELVDRHDHSAIPKGFHEDEKYHEHE